MAARCHGDNISSNQIAKNRKAMPPLGVFPLARLLKLLLEPGQASLQTVAGKLCGSDRSTHLCSLNYDGWIESLLTRFSSRRVGFLRSSLDFLK
jgi:hypothetical protein